LIGLNFAQSSKFSLPLIYVLRAKRSRTNRLERQDEMRVHEQDARWFEFLNLVEIFSHLSLHIKISEIHLKFGSMTNYLWEELN
jgi:hypothetical protein